MSHLPSDKRGFLPETLRTVTQFTSSRPWGTLAAVVLLSLLSCVLTVQFIQFKTKRSDLIDPNAPFHKRWLRYTKSFGDASDIVFVVESESTRRVKETLEEIAKRLRQHPELFSQILYKVDLRPLRRKGLQYLSPQALQRIASEVEQFQPVLAGRWDLLKLDGLVSRLRVMLAYAVQRERKLLQASSLRTDSNGRTVPLDELSARRGVESTLTQVALLTRSLKSSLQEPARFQPPWPPLPSESETVPQADFQVAYLTSEDGTIGFLKTKPAEASEGFSGPAKACDTARQILKEIRVEHPDVRVGLTGIPVLESDEMRKSQQDMMEASAISLVGVIVLLVVGFRGFRHPLLALAMLTVGMAWSFGYTTLTVGHLNILSVSFAVILIGLGIDFAIHYLARYLQLRHEGYEWQPALLEASEEIGVGIVTAAVTTALAFFCTLFTDFLGVAELGIIAGGGILLCAVATFVVLPALLALVDSRVEPKRLPTPFQGNWLRRLVSNYPMLVITVALGIVVVVSLQAFELRNGKIVCRVRYDSNLLNLQAEGVESVETERRIAHRSHGSLLFAVSLADSAEEARVLHAQYEKLPMVSRVEDLASRLPLYPASQTCPLIARIHEQLKGLEHLSTPHFGVLDPATVGRQLEGLLAVLRTVPTREAQQTAQQLDRFLDQFAQLNLQQQLRFLSRYQNQLAATLLAQLRALAAASDPSPVTLKDFPPELVSRYVSSDGKWLVQVFPDRPIWDQEPLAKFVAQVRTVDPNVTGTPIQNYEASRQIMSSYKLAACYALVVIGLVLLIDFLGRDLALLATLPSMTIVAIAAVALSLRNVPVSPVAWLTAFVVLTLVAAVLLDFESVRDTALALLPPVVGGLLMFGLLAVFHIDLNPANLIVLPLISGIGVDDGVHVLHDFRLQNGPYRPSPSTINAIVLTSLTSMIGFGSLMISSHRGLYSLGIVLVTGIGCCLFISLVLLPSLLTLLSKKNREVSGDHYPNGISVVRAEEAAA